MVSSPTVSYTHLDVYKRQVYDGALPAIVLSCVALMLAAAILSTLLTRALVPVSYTHLDVYKRQVGIQRMTGQIQAADLFFLLQQLGVTVLRQLADLIAVLLCGILLSPLITENRSSWPSRLRRVSVSMLFRMPSTASTWL